MASTRKSRTANKRYSKSNEEWADKDGTNLSTKSTGKRKLSDMLGPQWSKEELERFYEAYCKYGKDWRKVAGIVRNRSSEMTEALNNMNKAYLSLPEGTATVAGLIAMMTDHYNILEGSDSERESNDVIPSRKRQKRARGKYRLMSKGSDGPFPDLLQCQPASSSYACMSLLKKKRSGGSRPRAVGKRTPRIPVSSMYSKLGAKGDGSSTADEGAHVAALALAEASQRGGSPQISRTQGRRGEHSRLTPVQSAERKDADSEMADSKPIGVMDVEGLEGSLGSREAENGDFTKDASYTFGTHEKEKMHKGKRLTGTEDEDDHFDDDSEACSGTEEGLTRKIKDETDMEVMNSKAVCASKVSRRRNRQLFSTDEPPTFDALQTLADLSFHILFPSSTVESESSIQVKDEKRNVDTDERLSIPESRITDKDRARSSIAEVDDVIPQGSKSVKGLAHDSNASAEINQQNYAPLNKIQKRKGKSLGVKVSKTEFDSDSQKSEAQKIEASVEEPRRSINKAKWSNQGSPLMKQGKSFKMLEWLPSGTDLSRGVTDSIETMAQVSSTSQVNMRTRVRSQRKMDLQKALAGKESKSNDSVGDDRPESYALRVNKRLLDMKERLSHCLSSRLLRRWCVIEWFYSAIDYPWFAKTEFVEYLNHVKLGHVPRLTRVEWSVIRSSLGKPRRLSKKFLQEEREKLGQYRESVRTHYAELRAGVKEGLPTDLARPLSVGQRVSACHPKTREIHDGSVLTVDRSRCRVQFDRPELGVEFVMDIDCMPLNPLENMPEALRRQNIGIYKFYNSLMDVKLDGKPKEWKIGQPTNLAPNEISEIADGSAYISSPTGPFKILMQEAKATAALSEVSVSAHQAMYSQPCTLVQIQAREADIRALAELACALDKKEALLIELKHMNDEVYGNQKDSIPIMDLENFRKQYAMVLLQLRDANDQVASALLYMRQRNTYPGNLTPLWNKPIENSGGSATHQGSFNPALLTQESGTNVLEIVQSSRQKARMMVDVAVQAIHDLKGGEDAFVKIGEAMDHNCNSSSGAATVRYVPPDPSHENSAHHRATANHICSPKPEFSNDGSDGNEVHFPSELISNCVSTLFMMQNCTERQYPPAEVAQILDSAVTSLQPCCPQNFSIYREIERCIGIIKNQMLALIPTPSAILSAGGSVM